MQFLALLLFCVVSVKAFPWVADAPGVDGTLLNGGHHPIKKRDDPSCPFNANRPGAAPYSPDFPYSGAQNGLPGSQTGGFKVPADGDTAHAYTPPGPNDIRGPCPGLNTAANHNFLSHDGITTFNELVDAQQNVYNVGYDLAVFLAVLGIAMDGDIVTSKLSIGCDATSRTALNPLLGAQPGLNGHNKFEGDTSLTRNDFFPANGNNFLFNGSLFAAMKSYADSTSGGNFDFAALAAYRSARYEESKATNPNFYFGPKSLILYGAATFLYELFPNFGPEGPADLANVGSFFGATPDSSAPGGWINGGERIPEPWFSRRSAYTLSDVSGELLDMYLAYPKLFGGNAGNNNFNLLGSFRLIRDGQLPDDVTAAQITCLLYQIATDNVPSSLSTVIQLPLEVLTWVLGKLNPIFINFGCPLKII